MARQAWLCATCLTPYGEEADADSCERQHVPMGDFTVKLNQAIYETHKDRYPSVIFLTVLGPHGPVSIQYRREDPK